LIHTRRFALSFVDPGAVTDRRSPLPVVEEWTAAVAPAPDRSSGAATDAANRTAWLITIAAVAVMLGLVLTLGAVKASTQLALMKAEFVSSATHELKTPLAAIQLVSETLQKGRYNSIETIRTYAAALSEQTQLLARLIDNLLVYASLNDVEQRYTFEPLSLVDVVEKALERFDERIVAIGLDVHVQVPRDLPVVTGDRQAIIQVLDNVIDNAIKYSPGAETLTIRGFASRGMACIEVEDAGVGIPAEERTKVFQRFYRGRAVTTGGTGLGLAIARRVVEDHEGQIAIRSGQPKGTVVSISLPVASQRSMSWRDAFSLSKTMRRLRAYSRTILPTRALSSSVPRTAVRPSKR
jgi:signal transduction histidine kinase